jgi:hypothetical protein
MGGQAHLMRRLFLEKTAEVGRWWTAENKHPTLIIMSFANLFPCYRGGSGGRHKKQRNQQRPPATVSLHISVDGLFTMDLVTTQRDTKTKQEKKYIDIFILHKSQIAIPTKFYVRSRDTDRPRFHPHSITWHHSFSETREKELSEPPRSFCGCCAGNMKFVSCPLNNRSAQHTRNKWIYSILSST